MKIKRGSVVSYPNVEPTIRRVVVAKHTHYLWLRNEDTSLPQCPFTVPVSEVVLFEER